MAGPLLRILLRLNGKKYHRLQIAARYRLIDLFKQIAADFHLSVDQLLHVSIYRRGPNGCSLVYPFNKTYPDTSYDVSSTLDSYGLSTAEELYIDLTDVLPCHDDDEDDEDEQQKQQQQTLANPSTTVQKSLSTVGQLSRYAVPADNSCLFTSVYFVLHSGKFDLSSNKYLRNLVASKIESDQLTYSEAMLGRSNADYCQWIRRDDSWGGGIELAILTQEYQIEICVLNTESGGRIDYFGEDRHFPYRVFLLYDNLHYDPVCLVTYDVVEQKQMFQTKFPRTNETILSLAKDLVLLEQSNNAEKLPSMKS